VLAEVLRDGTTVMPDDRLMGAELLLLYTALIKGVSFFILLETVDSEINSLNLL